MKFYCAAAIAILMTINTFCYSRELYRAPTAGDSGTYYVLTHEKIDLNISKVLTSRIGKNNEYTDFTELNINCASKQYLELASNNEDGAQEKPTKPLKAWSNNSKWTSLVAGSSKYELVQFICKRHRANNTPQQ
ncbi:MULTISPECIES: hypothetical protein [unclassified Pseudomonas]|uniref:hypothetical protein n=1 Tax=unclassified Pseudomonas TaxID=196821 RepID=UPI0012691F55|nr:MULTISPECIES: hypothetical protein [unclassified Pseudomonas]